MLFPSYLFRQIPYIPSRLFLVLTPVRSGTARGALWDEIDTEGREWRITGTRTKSGADHRAPLSQPALAVLDAVAPSRDDSGAVIPSPIHPGRPISDMTLTKLLRDNGRAERATVHAARRHGPLPRPHRGLRSRAGLRAVPSPPETPSPYGPVGEIRQLHTSHCGDASSLSPRPTLPTPHTNARIAAVTRDATSPSAASTSPKYPSASP